MSTSHLNSDLSEVSDLGQAVLIAQTEKAGLFRLEDYSDDAGGSLVEWFPWSVVDPGSPSKNGEPETLYVSRWFAEKEGYV